MLYRNLRRTNRRTGMNNYQLFIHELLLSLMRVYRNSSFSFVKLRYSLSYDDIVIPTALNLVNDYNLNSSFAAVVTVLGPSLSDEIHVFLNKFCTNYEQYSIRTRLIFANCMWESLMTSWTICDHSSRS